MSTVKTPYEDMLRDILANGVDKADRTGTGTRSVFGRQIRYDLNEGFPLLTTKKVFMRGTFEELMWFLRGDTNEHALRDKNVNIWREWAREDGSLGPVYGHQWRSWEAVDGRVIDQIGTALDQIRNTPDSRRIIVSAWNVGDLDKMALPPCHLLFQFYVANGKLSCQVYQRSCDIFLGVPFNIASYALLTHMMAQQAGLGVGELVWTGGDVHIYSNHFEQVHEQLSRDARPYPTLDLKQRGGLFDYEWDDVTLIGYDPHPAIKAPVAV